MNNKSDNQPVQQTIHPSTSAAADLPNAANPLAQAAQRIAQRLSMAGITVIKVPPQHTGQLTARFVQKVKR